MTNEKAKVKHWVTLEYDEAGAQMALEDAVNGDSGNPVRIIDLSSRYLIGDKDFVDLKGTKDVHYAMIRILDDLMLEKQIKKEPLPDIITDDMITITEDDRMCFDESMSDEQIRRDIIRESSLEELYEDENIDEKVIEEAFDKCFVSKPVYLYDHSGITISTGPFGCPWDSGQIGFVFASKEELKKDYHLDPEDSEFINRAEHLLDQCVAHRDCLIRGEVYYLSLETYYEIGHEEGSIEWPDFDIGSVEFMLDGHPYGKEERLSRGEAIKNLVFDCLSIDSIREKLFKGDDSITDEQIMDAIGIRDERIDFVLQDAKELSIDAGEARELIGLSAENEEGPR